MTNADIAHEEKKTKTLIANINLVKLINIFMCNYMSIYFLSIPDSLYSIEIQKE